MAWASGHGEAGSNRPPRPLVELTEQLALAAAADFTRRLVDLVVDEAAPGAGSAPSDGGRSRPGTSTDVVEFDGKSTDGDREELDLLRSRLHSLSLAFADKFTACVDDQVTTLWKQQQQEEERAEGADNLAVGLSMKKGGGKLRRSFRKKFSRKKHKESPEAEAERKQMKKLEKEGQLKQLVDLAGSEMQWVKCRVCLKRQPGGFMLSFFSPPKSAQPRSGIFCFLITEVRQTTHEELPDAVHSFVVRGDNNMEYILLCHSNTEMWSWIAALRECSRLDSVKRNIPGPVNGTPSAYVVNSDEDDDDEEPPPPPPPDNTSQENIAAAPPLPAGGIQGADGGGRRDDGAAPSAGMAMTTPSRGLAAANSSNSLDAMVDPPPDREYEAAGDNAVFDRHPSVESASAESVQEHIEQLFTQPWFHGMLSRQEATMLVCQGATEAHGTFLVRQSESRQGQLVLTFNCRGRAKHMRMTVVKDGLCKVHQWTFDNVFHMLDYFKVHPVPLDNGAESDVVLSSYVVASSGASLSPGYSSIPGVSPTSYSQVPQFVIPSVGQTPQDVFAPPVQQGFRASSPPLHYNPDEGALPTYANDVFPGGVMIAPPSMQALHEHSGSHPLAMTPLGGRGSIGGGGVGPVRVAVSAASGPVSRPRSSTTSNSDSDFRTHTLPLTRPSNHYHVS